MKKILLLLAVTLVGTLQSMDVPALSLHNQNTASTSSIKDSPTVRRNIKRIHQFSEEYLQNSPSKRAKLNFPKEGAKRKLFPNAAMEFEAQQWAKNHLNSLTTVDLRDIDYALVSQSRPQEYDDINFQSSSREVTRLVEATGLALLHCHTMMQNKTKEDQQRLGNFCLDAVREKLQIAEQRAIEKNISGQRTIHKPSTASKEQLKILRNI